VSGFVSSTDGLMGFTNFKINMTPATRTRNLMSTELITYPTARNPLHALNEARERPQPGDVSKRDERGYGVVKSLSSAACVYVCDASMHAASQQ
jgi:hypothetical protein